MFIASAMLCSNLHFFDSLSLLSSTVWMYFSISSMGSGVFVSLSTSFIVFVTLCSSSSHINWSCEPKQRHGSGGLSYGVTQTPLGYGVCSICGRISSLNGGLFLLGHEPIVNGFLGLAPPQFDGGNHSLPYFEEFHYLHPLIFCHQSFPVCFEEFHYL